MRLRTLRTRGFRNLEDGDLEFPPEGAAILGENAQGKSNLLEAIYYLEALRSFRGSRDDQLIRFGADHFRLVGSLEPGSAEGVDRGGDPPSGTRREETDPLEVAAAFQRSPRTKKVTLNGDEAERLAEGVGRVGAVIFTPDDLRLITDGPQERRRFLDTLLSLNDRAYLSALQRFRQILAQRNAALRDGAPAAGVRAWDNGLVRAGAVVSLARLRWVQEASPGFRKLYGAVSGGDGARMEYVPGIPGAEGAESEDEIQEAFLASLEGDRERERTRGTTLSGPQRDELRFQHEGGEGEGDRDLRAFGSGGQRRTAALALRLLEAEAVRSRRGREPLLLLDDVFAELDEGRSGRVLDLLEEAAVGQVILTAPKEADLRFRRDRLSRWVIRAGRVDR